MVAISEVFAQACRAHYTSIPCCLVTIRSGGSDWVGKFLLSWILEWPEIDHTSLRPTFSGKVCKRVPQGHRKPCQWNHANHQVLGEGIDEA